MSSPPAEQLAAYEKTAEQSGLRAAEEAAYRKKLAEAELLYRSRASKHFAAHWGLFEKWRQEARRRWKDEFPDEPFPEYLDKHLYGERPKSEPGKQRARNGEYSYTLINPPFVQGGGVTLPTRPTVPQRHTFAGSASRPGPSARPAPPVPSRSRAQALADIGRSNAPSPFTTTPTGQGAAAGPSLSAPAVPRSTKKAQAKAAQELSKVLGIHNGIYLFPVPLEEARLWRSAKSETLKYSKLANMVLKPIIPLSATAAGVEKAVLASMRAAVPELAEDSALPEFCWMSSSGRGEAWQVEEIALGDSTEDLDTFNYLSKCSAKTLDNKSLKTSLLLFPLTSTSQSIKEAGTRLREVMKAHQDEKMKIMVAMEQEKREEKKRMRVQLKALQPAKKIGKKGPKREEGKYEESDDEIEYLPESEPAEEEEEEEPMIIEEQTGGVDAPETTLANGAAAAPVIGDRQPSPPDSLLGGEEGDAQKELEKIDACQFCDEELAAITLTPYAQSRREALRKGLPRNGRIPRAKSGDYAAFCGRHRLEFKFRDQLAGDGNYLRGDELNYKELIEHVRGLIESGEFNGFLDGSRTSVFNNEVSRVVRKLPYSNKAIDEGKRVWDRQEALGLGYMHPLYNFLSLLFHNLHQSRSDLNSLQLLQKPFRKARFDLKFILELLLPLEAASRLIAKFNESDVPKDGDGAIPIENAIEILRDSREFGKTFGSDIELLDDEEVVEEMADLARKALVFNRE